MNDDIPSDLVDKMMVKCGRRCCICRRFRPTKLQLHHIKERTKGGGNEEDNLIVTCLSCHTDVHSKVPFARRFSDDELKGHRDALVKLVKEGKLPPADTDEGDELMRKLLEGLHTDPVRDVNLSSTAVEVLLKAVTTCGPEQGSILLSRGSMGLTIKMGDSSLTLGGTRRREQAKYKNAVKHLVNCRLLEHVSEQVLDVTEEGYLAADEIMVARGQSGARVGEG